MRRDEMMGMDGAAYGEAPMGPANVGQPTGEPYPGNGRLVIDKRNQNPAMPDLRIDALYRTIESRDLEKRHAGQRMADMLNGRPRNV